jgi:branched-chain amino acid transport system substrate-binding protein
MRNYIEDSGGGDRTGFSAGPAAAQQKVKIGFITTLSGPNGVIGEHMKNSVELALDHLGRKMAGLDVEVIYGDDQFKPTSASRSPTKW